MRQLAVMVHPKYLANSLGVLKQIRSAKIIRNAINSSTVPSNLNRFEHLTGLVQHPWSCFQDLILSRRDHAPDKSISLFSPVSVGIRESI